MKSVVFFLTLVIGSASYSNVQAQARWYVGPGFGGYGGGYGYGYGGASTPASAAGHAMADMTRSQGMYNAMTSAAMINVEDARSKYIENQRQWTDVYMMKQRIVAAQHAEAKEEARARNAKIQEAQASQSNLPPRLSSSELDPTTGQIYWPSALMRDVFTDQRREIDALFMSRTHTGTTSELSETIYKKVRGMQDELRKHIRDIVTQEYMDARKFLDRLSLEGRYPVAVGFAH